MIVLHPNRRVEITASGSVLKLQEGGQSNGGYSRSSTSLSKIIDREDRKSVMKITLFFI